MRLILWYQRSKNRWWALPLILPALFLPLVVSLNTQTLLDGGRVFLLYMPLAFMTAFVMLFGWAAFPGIVLALLIRYVPLKGELMASVYTLHCLVPLGVSWFCYHVFVPRRHAVRFDMINLVAARMFWLVWVNGTLFLLFYETGLLLGIYDTEFLIFPDMLWTVRTLINYQAVLIGSMIGLPFFYYLLRIIVNPRFIKSFWSRMRTQIQPGVTFSEIMLWGGLVVLLALLLLNPINETSTIFSTDYTLILLLPVMLWGAMRFGFLFITQAWTLLLIILSNRFHNYQSPDMGMELHLAIVSSCYGVFSVTIYLMAGVITRQRIFYNKARRLAYIDPVLQMPNLRALSRDIGLQRWSVISLITIPDLELLGRNYGVLLRIQYKQQLAAFLRKELMAKETVYHLSGASLALRLQHDSDAEHDQLYPPKIEAIYQRLRQFRFVWNGLPLQPQVGMSYCYVRHPVSHLYLLLGELSTMAERSLTTFHPENLQMQGSNPVQNEVKHKVEMMNRLQHALDNGRFVLMAQRIEGMRGDSHYEILLRMLGDNQEMLTPDIFMPIAQEFGLSSRIDRWVLNAVLMFMSRHSKALPGCQFSINLTPASVCRAHFPLEVKRLLTRYHIEPWQLIFEITDCDSLVSLKQANNTINMLQHMGCRIAIDNFGAGYGTYAILKELSADILKIDGRFIRNILSSSLDYQAVSSICQLARIKKMQIVAECVETEAIREVVTALGIDYIQGFLISSPQPLEDLVNDKNPPL
ncbi:EAL domain-containing protein [Citrobacter sp. JGM124]|uniref:sensor domain-containing phosphodiesterase n=1 Tax=Citrobacter sp. JGM124 TaxID=2799789 RepID=UPI001BA57A45|nr:EAL domain-containing protein [Citrobacter sp. JGM124]MBS0849006.1 EAL domain-containing protein [Citrobacter sp. JGM124]